MSRSSGATPNEISKEIRRQIGQAANKRFLRSLPQFHVDPDLPEPFTGLLAEIERTELRRRKNVKAR